MTVVFQVLVGAAIGVEPVPSCDALFREVGTEVRPRPAARPTLWWVLADPPCPAGTRPGGAPPPDGRDLWCEDARGRRTGPRTTFHPQGYVHTESSFDRNREVGPRTEWDAAADRVLRVLRFDDEGLVDGETVEWSADGASSVTRWGRGQKDGVTWRLDPRNQLVFAEQWRDGERHGRSCTWRDGKLEVDQVWDAGVPVKAGP